MSEPVLSVRNLKVAFPTRRATLTAVDDVSFDDRRRRGAGRGRRIRRRQVADRRRRHRPARAAGTHHGRRGAPGRPAHRQPAAGGDAQGARPAHRHGVPGPAHQPQSALSHRRPDRRDHPHARRRVGGAGARARHRPAGGGRHPGRAGADRQLSARVLRRHAPARGAGAGLVRRARPADRRRADHGARRVDPGADHRASEAALPRARHGGDADHPRHGRDRRDGGPRGRDVCRTHRRDRAGARRGQAPPPPLHQGADGGDPDGGRRMPAGWCRSRARCRGSPPSPRAAPSTRAAPMPSTAAGSSGPRACKPATPRWRAGSSPRSPQGCRHDACVGGSAGRGEGPHARVRRLQAVAQPRHRGRAQGLPESGDRHLVRHRPARDAGAGGRVGLRQVDGGAHGGRAAAAHGRRGDHRRHRHVGTGARRRAPDACAGACR